MPSVELFLSAPTYCPDCEVEKCRVCERCPECDGCDEAEAAYSSPFDIRDVDHHLNGFIFAVDDVLGVHVPEPEPEPEPRKSKYALNDTSPLWMWRRWPDGGR